LWINRIGRRRWPDPGEEQKARPRAEACVARPPGRADDGRGYPTRTPNLRSFTTVSARRHGDAKRDLPVATSSRGVAQLDWSPSSAGEQTCLNLLEGLISLFNVPK
jgi:hypothetical protein